MPRKNFAFRFEWQLAIADLPSIIRLEIYEQTVRYAETGEVSFESERAEAAFNTHILPDFKRREKAAEYRARRKARLEQKRAEQVGKAGTTTQQSPVQNTEDCVEAVRTISSSEPCARTNPDPCRTRGSA